MGNAPSYAKIATITWYREGSRCYGMAGFESDVLRPATAAAGTNPPSSDEDFLKKFGLPRLAAVAPPILAGGAPEGKTAAQLAGRLAVVTGANQGIGYAAALGLAQLGAEVVLVCRSLDKAEEARDKINDNALVQARGGTAKVALADLSDFDSVRKLADEAMVDLTGKGERPIDILVNNAGAMPKTRQWTVKGNHDVGIATALGGTVLLTDLLLPHMRRKGPSDFDPRVINVSSGGQYTVAPRGDVPDDLDLRKGWERDSSYDGTLAYAYAKRYQTELTLVMAQMQGGAAEQQAGRAVSFFSMHPGWTATVGVATAMPEFEAKHRNTLRTLEQGADTILFLAAAPREALNASAEAAKENRVLEPFWEPPASSDAVDASSALPGSGHFFFDRRIVRRDMPCGGTTWTDAQREVLLREARRYVGLTQQ